jgi:hypothetical protein
MVSLQSFLHFTFYHSTHILYTVLCSEKYLQMLIRLLQYLTPDSLQIDEVIREVQCGTAVCCAMCVRCAVQ